MSKRLFNLLGLNQSENALDVENNEYRRRHSKRSSDTFSDWDLFSSRNFISSTKYSVKTDSSKKSTDSPAEKMSNPCVEAAESASNESLSSSFVLPSSEDTDSSSNEYASSSSDEYNYYPCVKAGIVSEIDDTPSPKQRVGVSFFSRQSHQTSLTNSDFRRLYYAGRSPAAVHPGPPPSAERFRQFPSLSQMRTSTICIDIPEEDEIEPITAVSATITAWPLVTADTRNSETNVRRFSTATALSLSHYSNTNVVDEVTFVRTYDRGCSSALRPRKESWLQSLWRTLSHIGSMPYSPSCHN